MVIGITDNMGAEHKWQWYIDWLRRSNVTHETLKLSYKLDNLSSIKGCHGLLLTGGGDVDPALYSSDLQNGTLCKVDRKRDDFERHVIDIAVQEQIPMLGICRGLQIANVHFGGTLIPDLQGAGYLSHQTNLNSESRHVVNIGRGSLLAKVTQSLQGSVNSSHHQAVDTPGEGLKVCAVSEDGVVEALEFADGNSLPFFLLVQWHPERMNDTENPLSKNILERFLSAINQGNEKYNFEN